MSMSLGSNTTDPDPITIYVEEGARIAAILLVWGVLAAFFAVGVADLGGPGSLFGDVGWGLGWVFSITGILNAILYVCFRTVDRNRR